jgi:hypothetical protein
MYRGNGSIEFSNDGLHISGRHIFRLGVGWGIGLMLFLGLIGTTSKIGRDLVIPICLIISLFVDSLLLKRENIVVSYADILSYVERRKRGLVAIDFKGPKWCAPVVLESESWAEIIAALRELVPERDASLTVFPPSSAPAAIGWSALAFAIIYLLFFFAVYLAILFVQNVGSIDDITNDILRTFAWRVAFVLPLLPSILFAIKIHKEKSRPSRANGLEIH